MHVWTLTVALRDSYAAAFIRIAPAQAGANLHRHFVPPARAVTMLLRKNSCGIAERDRLGFLPSLTSHEALLSDCVTRCRIP